MAYTELYTSYFICPSCFEPVIEYDKLKDMEYDLSKHNFCTNCGHEINSILQQERQIRLQNIATYFHKYSATRCQCDIGEVRKVSENKGKKKKTASDKKRPMTEKVFDQLMKRYLKFPSRLRF